MTDREQDRWDSHHEAHLAEKEHDATRWQAHREQHDTIARALTEYKAQSNEWRALVSDMRASYATLARIEEIERHADTLHADLAKAIAIEREERRDQQNLRQGASTGISRGAAIIAGGAAFLVALLSIALMAANLVRLGQ
jgi:uncharacterized membrane protein YqiK